jgi:hypothetical protein
MTTWTTKLRAEDFDICALKYNLATGIERAFGHYPVEEQAQCNSGACINPASLLYLNVSTNIMFHDLHIFSAMESAFCIPQHTTSTKSKPAAELYSDYDFVFRDIRLCTQQVSNLNAP